MGQKRYIGSGGDDISNSYFPSCQIRTNFIKSDGGFKDGYLTYEFEDDLDSDFISCRILIYAFIDLYKDAHFITRTSIQELFQICGAKGDKKRYKTRAIYELIKECIQWFIDAEYIKLADNKKFDSFSFDQLLKIQIIEENFYPSVKYVGGKEKIDEPFITITIDEFDAVMSVHTQRRPRVMYVLAYIKSQCGYRIKDQSIAVFPKVALLTQRQISKHTGFTQAKVSGYIDQLCDANAIKRRELKRQAENQNPPHIYAANEDGWEQELYYGELKYNRQREIKGD